MTYSKKGSTPQKIKLLRGVDLTDKTIKEVAHYTGHSFERETYDKLLVKEGVCAWPGTHGENTLLFPASSGGWKAYYYRHPDKDDRWRFTSAGKLGIQGSLSLNGDGPIYLMEGEWDQLAMLEAGFKNALTCGAASSLNTTLPLVKYFKDRVVYILFDVNDKQKVKGKPFGEYHALRVAKILFRIAKEVRNVRLPMQEEGADVEMFLQKNSRQALEVLVQATEPWTDPAYNVPGVRVLLDLLYGTTRSEYSHYQKLQLVSSTTIKELEQYGRFYTTKEHRCFYFFDKTKELWRLERDFRETNPTFVAFFNNQIGLNEALQPFQYTWANLAAYIYEKGEPAQVYRNSYWDDENGTLYISDNASKIFVLDGSQICTVDNGYNGVLFEGKAWHEAIDPEPGESGIYYRLLIAPVNFVTGKETRLAPEEQRLMMKAWHLASFFPQLMPTKPILTFTGPKGSGKTTQARKFIQLHYGQAADVLTIGGDRKDFTVMCHNNFLLALDNVDYKTKWLEDEFSVVGTGGHASNRQLYTDTDESRTTHDLFLILTSRTPQFRREDVSDRLLILKVDRINEFRPESDIQQELRSSRPSIWADILTTLNEVVKRLRENPKTSTAFRLADFGSFGQRTLGKHAEQFCEAMRKMTLEQIDFALEEDTFFQLLSELIYDRDKAGTYTMAKLYEALAILAKEHEMKLGVKNSTGLARHFRSILVSLQAHFEISEGEPSGRVATWKIGKKGERTQTKTEQKGLF